MNIYTNRNGEGSWWIVHFIGLGPGSLIQFLVQARSFIVSPSSNSKHTGE